MTQEMRIFDKLIDMYRHLKDSAGHAYVHIYIYYFIKANLRNFTLVDLPSFTIYLSFPHPH